MRVLWMMSKNTAAFILLVGLVFASGVFSVLLYGKITGKEWAFTYKYANALPLMQVPPSPSPSPAATVSPAPARKTSAMLDAPVYRQYPELPSGCEVTSLAMLLNFAGIAKSKMDLVQDLPRDPTPIQRDGQGNIVFWGNPNKGFVGDITGRSKGFGIFHGALFGLLKQYIPEAKDLTRSEFNLLEDQIAGEKPVLVWTTVDFQVPDNWVVWDTADGPIQTTFMEHAVLLVGYDEESVYVNDPWTGKAQTKVNKDQFIQTWEAMGRQALSY